MEKIEITAVIGSIGGLLVINRLFTNFQTEETIAPTEHRLLQISKIIDLEDEIDNPTISDIYKTYLNINEIEFRRLKDNIISETLTRLKNLRNNKRTERLTTGDYYDWLLPMLFNVSATGSIKAVSCMKEAEWDDSEEEKKFIKGNLQAALLGAKVERVFIMKKDLLPEAFYNDAILNHTSEERNTTNLIGYFADLDDLESRHRDLLNKINEGFIIFNSKVALIDIFDEHGSVRGIVTMDAIEIKELEKVFDRLKNASCDLNKMTLLEIS